MIRFLFFVTLIFAAINLPWWFGVFLFSIYAVSFEGIEIIILGAMIDSYYGFSYGFPLYTCVTAVMLITAGYVRPYLSV